MERFCSVAGNLTVAYDATKGNLAGLGGPVESFSAIFMPTDLVSKPDVNDPENIEVANVTALGTLMLISYFDFQNGGEHIEISGISATGALTHVDDI